MNPTAEPVGPLDVPMAETEAKPTFQKLLDIPIKAIGGISDRALVGLPADYRYLRVSVTLDSGAFTDFFLAGLDDCDHLKMDTSGVHQDDLWLASTGDVTGWSKCPIPTADLREVRFGVEQGRATGHLEIAAMIDVPVPPAPPKDNGHEPGCDPSCI